jgi:hypothetical protein
LIFLLVALQGLTPSRPIQRKNFLVINDLESLPGIQRLREMDPGSGPPRPKPSYILIKRFWVRLGCGREFCASAALRLVTVWPAPDLRHLLTQPLRSIPTDIARPARAHAGLGVPAPRRSL